ncbi:MAG: dihydrolipoyl dehydrogenase [Betaproteobacteria bacterium]|nr:dihydrolipoyl dehydrogenase [Betaproteobacteria bacterium]
MAKAIEVQVPDIGDFHDVPVIEVLVRPGDTVAKDDSLIALESEKATMEVPAPQAGKVAAVQVKTGDKVSKGSVIVTLEVEEAEGAEPARPVESKAPAQPAPAPAARAAAPAAAPSAPAQPPAQARQSPPAQREKTDLQTDVVVLGAGPGGYTAAFRAADLGKKVVLVERYPTLGGVCLNVGCIPSKALLHIAKVISEADEVGAAGIRFGKPQIDLAKLKGWKESVVGRLTKGLSGLARQRKVEVVQGAGKFASPHSLRVETANGAKTIGFDHCIIATGSESARIPGLPYDDKRLIDSTGALELASLPKRMLVIGGGIIGLEMATVYDALGTKVSVVEMMESLIPGADSDLLRPLRKRIDARYEQILLGTKVARLEPSAKGLTAHFEGASAPKPQTFDVVLFAVGRRPNGHTLGLDAAGVNVDARGFIPVDRQLRTNVGHIHAIGDVVGDPMLAHKATHEGKVAAEVIAGHKASFDARTIPSVAYTDPEIAWMGMSEAQLNAAGTEYDKAVFPWAASGRSLAMGREDGMTKLLFERGSRRLLGAGIVGPNAGELIAETVLALEMGAEAGDIALTIHPHPTLSETVYFAAEIAEGSITDLYLPKR